MCYWGFLENIHSFFPLNDKKGIKITNPIEKTLDKSRRKPNKIWVKVVNFTVDQKNGYKTMAYKCIQLIMKKNLLLLKDLLGPWRVKFVNIRLQYQKMCILVNWMI